MLLDPLAEEERTYYNYYDTPDGQDVKKKMMVTTRYGLVVGFSMATFDVLYYSRTVGITNHIKRYARHMVPLGLLGATFAAVANGVQHARQKDDSLNYFAGGMACGPLLAVYLRSGHAVLLGGLALGLAGIIKKDAVDNGWVLMPAARPHMSLVNGWRNDYTFTKDPRDESVYTCEKCKDKK